MKKVFLFILIFILSLLCCSISYCEKVSSDLQNNVFRLHIIANSDSDYDQSIKLILRDKIIEYMKNNVDNINSIDECKKYLNNNIHEINNIVKQTFDENKYDMSFSCDISKEFFPSKSYDDFNFPAGTYNCLKIKIGNNKGKNWWCVLYPNLCINDDSVKEIENSKLKSAIDSQTYNLVASNISYKFKIVEWYENFKNM